MVDNKTYWALKRREWAAKGKPPEAVIVGPPAEVIPEAVEVQEEPSYRDLQAQAKELDIPANQSADDLKAAIEDAEE